MATYYVKVYKENKKDPIRERITISGLEWARRMAYDDIVRRQYGAHVKIDCVTISDDLDLFVTGIVKVDPGLGVVYIQYGKGEAMHLTKSGKISRFTDANDIKRAKALRAEYWRGMPIPKK